MLVKIYGAALEGEKRYSPAECIGAVKHRIEGNPDPKYVSTSFAERNNLNVRMHSRRMTRLTNAFSKKVENHKHAMALHFLYYNFVRMHHILRLAIVNTNSEKSPKHHGAIAGNTKQTEFHS